MAGAHSGGDAVLKRHVSFSPEENESFKVSHFKVAALHSLPIVQALSGLLQFTSVTSKCQHFRKSSPTSRTFLFFVSMQHSKGVHVALCAYVLPSPETSRLLGSFSRSRRFAPGMRLLLFLPHSARRHFGSQQKAGIDRRVVQTPPAVLRGPDLSVSV